MEDECAVTRTADDSPLIRRQILICLLRLLLRPEPDLRSRDVGRSSRLTQNVNIARDRPRIMAARQACPTKPFSWSAFADSFGRSRKPRPTRSGSDRRIHARDNVA